jgi:integrase
MEKAAATFSELCHEYLTRHAKRRKRSWREDERCIRKSLLPALGDRPVREIQRGEVRWLLDAIADRGAGIEANRTLALVRKIFNWGISMDLAEKNPCALLPRSAPERRRSNVLRPAEIRAVRQALEKETPEAADALRLMLLTPQRGGEVVAMRWSDVDLDEGWWTIPAESAKNGLAHRVPLSQPALAILQERFARTESSSWVCRARGVSTVGRESGRRSSASGGARESSSAGTTCGGPRLRRWRRSESRASSSRAS